MRILDILNDKSIKKIDVRTLIIAGILDGTFTIKDIIAASDELNENKISAILESIEVISNKKLMYLSVDYLEFAKKYIDSKDNSCKRESSRIVGNMAARYPQVIEDCIPSLLENTKADGTVVRWGSAYALSRVILLEEYRDTDLFDKVVAICDNEQENGVKNQYVKALKKGKKRK